MVTSYRSVIIFSAVVLLLAGYNFINAAWTPASGTPPDNNTAAPLNVSATTQAKSGNLQANIFAATTEMRSNRYCDALGNNCFTATSTGGGGDTITVGGVCFEPAYLVTCNWNWSGDGNDSAGFVINRHADPQTYCSSISRTYMSHTTILAQCGISAGSYQWVASAWGSCTTYQGTCTTIGKGETYSCTKESQSRTVTCYDSINKKTVADSYCSSSVKPATTQSQCS